MELKLIAFILLLLSSFGSRYLKEQALKLLSPEQKVLLLDLFSQNRLAHYGILIVLLILFLVVLYFNVFPYTWSMTVYFLLIAGYTLYNSARSKAILMQHSFPEAYIRRYVQSAALSMTGLALFIALYLYP